MTENAQPKQLGPEYRNVSLSHATMIADDVFDAISYLLPPAMVAEYEAADEEEREYILNEEAWDYMNSIAPEGCYFGSHPGDGSDYGFWQDDDDSEENEE